jgi:alkylhydroperoxidase family enzyme
VSATREAAAARPSLAALQQATHDAVFDGPGVADPAIRRAVAIGRPPAALEDLVRKIREHAYRVTDADIDALRSQYTEDQLFELIVASAMGAAEHRLARALAVLEDA